MAAIASFTEFQVYNELKFSKDGKRVDFAIIDALESYPNIKFKIWVTAFDEAASKIARLGIKKGSLLNLTAELVPFYKKGSTDEIDIGYKIMDVNYSKAYKLFHKKEVTEKPSSPVKELSENEKKLESIKQAADMLANNPFF